MGWQKASSPCACLLIDIHRSALTHGKYSRMPVMASSDHTGQEPACWKQLGLLIALCLGLWAWTCGLWDLWGPDEARYVQIAKELLPRRNWFLLTLHGQPYDEKPPLPFWMLAGMLKLGQPALLRVDPRTGRRRSA